MNNLTQKQIIEIAAGKNPNYEVVVASGNPLFGMYLDYPCEYVQRKSDGKYFIIERK